jgi:hypothetical protein
MKLYLVAFAALLLVTPARAQIFTSSKNATSTAAFKKIIESSAKQFEGVKGEVSLQNPQTTEYASLIVPDDALDAKVIEYSSNKSSVFSWQGLLLRTESYDEAVKKYRTVFNQFKGMNVTYVVDNYTLTGKYEAPVETKKFATSILMLANPPQAFRKLRVEVTLQFEFPEWTVAVNIYDKEKDDKENGSAMEQ